LFHRNNRKIDMASTYTDSKGKTRAKLDRTFGTRSAYDKSKTTARSKTGFTASKTEGKTLKKGKKVSSAKVRDAAARKAKGTVSHKPKKGRQSSETKPKKSSNNTATRAGKYADNLAKGWKN